MQSYTSRTHTAHNLFTLKSSLATYVGNVKELSKKRRIETREDNKKKKKLHTIHVYTYISQTKSCHTVTDKKKEENNHYKRANALIISTG